VLHERAAELGGIHSLLADALEPTKCNGIGHDNTACSVPTQSMTAKRSLWLPGRQWLATDGVHAVLVEGVNQLRGQQLVVDIDGHIRRR
jgi:hypothetical protein